MLSSRRTKAFCLRAVGSPPYIDFGIFNVPYEKNASSLQAGTDGLILFLCLRFIDYFTLNNRDSLISISLKYTCDHVFNTSSCIINKNNNNEFVYVIFSLCPTKENLPILLPPTHNNHGFFCGACRIILQPHTYLLLILRQTFS